MRRMQKTARALALLALVIILIGCTTPTVVVPPTPDLPAVRTEAAQTVVARLTIEAALNPTATAAATQTPAEPVVITATSAPTEEATVTTAATAAPATATLIPTNAPSTGGLVPTITRRAGPDQAQLLSQEPRDGTAYSPGADFDAKWTFRNTGTSTWTVDYDYRFARGAEIGRANLYSVPREVKPGETVDLIADMNAPNEAGRYVSYWELTNNNGDVFYSFYVVIDVR